MLLINKLLYFKRIFIIIITSVLLLNTILILKSHSVSYKISEIEVSEEFGLEFNKEKVFDKAFLLAFKDLISMTVTSSDQLKLKNIDIFTIKSLIDSFNVKNEKFINEIYYAEFNVYFNKKNTLKFFENKNIFPSTPKKINTLLIPILIDRDNEKLIIFDDNPIYKNWNNTKNKHYLLNYILHNEDIEDRSILKKRLSSIEEYDFKEIIEKYDIENFIINMVFKEENKIKLLSKIKLKNDYKIISKFFYNVNLSDENSLKNFIFDIKNIYEDSWKKINIINTSIKLPITVSLPSNDKDKIILFERLVNKMDLVSDFYIINFNNKNIFYKVIYNGSPSQFLNDIKEPGFLIVKDDQNWKIE